MAEDRGLPRGLGLLGVEQALVPVLQPLGILGQVRLELAVIGQDHTALRSALPSAYQRDRRLTNRSDPGTIASQTNVWHILPHVSLSHAAAAQKERMHP